MLPSKSSTSFSSDFDRDKYRLQVKKIGYIILHIGTYLIILGGLADIGYTFSVSGIIPAHMDYLKINDQEISFELRNLDLGLLRAIGGLLVASGLGALIILSGQVKNGNKTALLGVIFIMTIGEGNNALQMYLLDSPFFAIPFGFLVLIWIGGILYLLAGAESSNSTRG